MRRGTLSSAACELRLSTSYRQAGARCLLQLKRTRVYGRASDRRAASIHDSRKHRLVHLEYVGAILALTMLLVARGSDTARKRLCAKFRCRTTETPLLRVESEYANEQRRPHIKPNDRLASAMPAYHAVRY
jgi:hypothetical protein